jgi:hypothetical protein
MTPKIVLAAILILSGYQMFSQDSIKGKIFDYETNDPLPGIIILDAYNKKNGIVSDKDGNFQLKIEGNKRNLELYFPAHYPIKFMNIPKENINFLEIKMVPNHLTDHWVIGGPSLPFSENQAEKDNKLRSSLKEYRINISGKLVKPYFVGPSLEMQSLVFDLDQQGNE